MLCFTITQTLQMKSNDQRELLTESRERVQHSCTWTKHQENKDTGLQNWAPRHCRRLWVAKRFKYLGSRVKSSENDNRIRKERIFFAKETFAIHYLYNVWILQN